MYVYIHTRVVAEARVTKRTREAVSARAGKPSKMMNTAAINARVRITIVDFNITVSASIIFIARAPVGSVEVSAVAVEARIRRALVGARHAVRLSVVVVTQTRVAVKLVDTSAVRARTRETLVNVCNMFQCH